MVIEIVVEKPGAFFIAGDTFYRTYPEVFPVILCDGLNNVIFYAPQSVPVAIIKDMERAAIEHIESIPGPYPKDMIRILEDMIYGAVGEAVSIVEVLKEELIVPQAKSSRVQGT
jgi:hypothetical protein